MISALLDFTGSSFTTCLRRVLKPSRRPAWLGFFRFFYANSGHSHATRGSTVPSHRADPTTPLGARPDGSGLSLQPTSAPSWGGLWLPPTRAHWSGIGRIV